MRGQKCSTPSLFNGLNISIWLDTVPGQKFKVGNGSGDPFTRRNLKVQHGNGKHKRFQSISIGFSDPVLLTKRLWGAYTKYALVVEYWRIGSLKQRVMSASFSPHKKPYLLARQFGLIIVGQLTTEYRS